MLISVALCVVVMVVLADISLLSAEFNARQNRQGDKDMDNKYRTYAVGLTNKILFMDNSTNYEAVPGFPYDYFLPFHLMRKYELFLGGLLWFTHVLNLGFCTLNFVLFSVQACSSFKVTSFVL